jgi:riboflavin synthase
MFTGIVEGLAKVVAVDAVQDNLTFTFLSPFNEAFKIDQSVAHNGVCLTVVFVNGNQYKVTAIKETLDKSNLKYLKIGDMVNIERCMTLGARLDGHIVQGHVDQVGTCVDRKNLLGSWEYTFEYDERFGNVTVEKGSICVNGTSLTVVNSSIHQFSVCIIPYTFENTVFKHIEKGTVVNLEFDIIGKYVQKLYSQQKNNL